ncbi:MAG: aminotransferase class I/II-fold pyridoxal phosphate-dependent enzyme [Cyclobacteriaceae bacterium]|nr:aminotransferase class I/II-fold pyridoxal phosphate-dependent enzyme [Cyclobacteriaceae bacterium SS2]
MMGILKDRFSHFQEPQKAQELGFYPFFRQISSEQGTTVTVNGSEVMMFGSNSYLGLTTHPKIKAAAEAAIKKYGTSCSGSRFLNGTCDLHVELEERLARFLKKESVLVFSTGFQVNIGVIPTITGKDDTILMDRLNHASIYEGARLSKAQTVIFRHNNMVSLEQKLKMVANVPFKLIIVDGIFSMEGDIAKLPDIVFLAKKYNAIVMTDCAHAIGVLGKNGSGTPSHFGLEDDVDIIGGTFSKSLASLGGFVGANKETINYLKHHSRSLIFSASITPASVAATLAALDIIESDDSLIQNLWKNTNHALTRLKSLGFDTGDAETPIIPIYIRDQRKTYDFTTELFKRGLFVNPVVAPAVAPQDSLIRFSLMATHTTEQIDKAIDIIYETAREIGVPLLSEVLIKS